MSENANAARRKLAAHAKGSNNGIGQPEYSTAELAAQRERYAALGLDVIPLQPGGKQCTVKGWQKRAPAELWQHAPAGANLGIRAGGSLGLAVLDLDEKNAPGTVAAGLAFLAGLGLADRAPHVMTPSGGAHVYLRLTSSPAGSVRLLKAGDFAGELRYGSGSYVGAPPSVLADGRAYRLVAGDFAGIPGVTFTDLLPLLGEATTTADTPALQPLPGASVDKLLSTALTLATTGNRNATGFWLCCMLRDKGIPLTRAAEVVKEYAATVTQGGHPYTEAEALASLRSAYSRTGHANYGGQQALDELAAGLMWAESYSWPGRTGRTDKAVLTAHLSVGWRACATVWDVSVREMAERNGIGTSTAGRATTRLINAGILHREATADRTEAASYRLGAQVAQPFQSGSHRQLDTSEARIRSSHSNSKQFDGSGRVQVTLDAAAAAAGAPEATPTGTNCLCDPLRDVTRSHDVFRFRALGKSAGDVYDALAAGPGTRSELAGRANMSKPTAWRSLRTLQAHGLATKIAGTWHRLEADLDAVAASLGTAGEGKRQAAQHERERESWREQCRLRLTAARQPMPLNELAQAERILANRQTRAEKRRHTAENEHNRIEHAATQDGTSTSTPPPLAAKLATETATAAPTEHAGTATRTHPPEQVKSLVQGLAGAMRWDGRWPDNMPKRTQAEYEERRRFLLAQVEQLAQAEKWEREHGQVAVAAS